MAKKKMGHLALVTLVVDESPSIDSFRMLLDKTVRDIVGSFKKSTNVLMRITAFSAGKPRQICAFTPARNLTLSAQHLTHYGNGTAIFDAFDEAAQETIKYATSKDATFSSMIFLLTDGEDNSSKKSLQEAKNSLAEIKKLENVSSSRTILVGVNSLQYENYLRGLKTLGFDGYVGFKDASESSFQRLSEYVSRCINSANQGRNSKDPFAKSDQKTSMEVSGFSCTLHMPKVAKTKEKGELPPFAPRPAFSVDDFSNVPESWMESSEKGNSYFVPVLEEHGLWLDFENNRDHDHDVAVVVSVQGINPLTGEKTEEIKLQQFRDSCPKHKKRFTENLMCPDCGYEWAPQNYLHTQSKSAMWLDGFRTQDGKVRQWYFSEEESRSVAGSLIGKDKVYAIGIAFYKSKKPKEKGYRYGGYNPYARNNWSVPGTPIGAYFGGTVPVGPSGNIGMMGPVPGKPIGWAGAQGIHALTQLPSRGGPAPTATPPSAQGTPTTKGIYALGAVTPTYSQIPLEVQFFPIDTKSGTTSIIGAMNEVKCSNMDSNFLSFDGGASAVCEDEEFVEPAMMAGVAPQPKKLEIAAGQELQQDTDKDTNDLSYWEEEPSGFIYINYCDPATALSLINSKKQRVVRKEGFLEGIIAE